MIPSQSIQQDDNIKIILDDTIIPKVYIDIINEGLGHIFPVKTAK